MSTRAASASSAAAARGASGPSRSRSRPRLDRTRALLRRAASGSRAPRRAPGSATRSPLQPGEAGRRGATGDEQLAPRVARRSPRDPGQRGPQGEDVDLAARRARLAAAPALDQHGVQRRVQVDLEPPPLARSPTATPATLEPARQAVVRGDVGQRPQPVGRRPRRRRPSSGCSRGAVPDGPPAAATNARAVGRGRAGCCPSRGRSRRRRPTPDASPGPVRRTTSRRAQVVDDRRRRARGPRSRAVALGVAAPGARPDAVAAGRRPAPPGWKMMAATGATEASLASGGRPNVRRSAPTSGSGRTSASATGRSRAGSGRSRLLPGVRLHACRRLYATRARRRRSTSRGSGTPSSPSTSRRVRIRRPARSPARRAEAARAGVRPTERERWGPRELDLDLLVFGRARLAIDRPPAGSRSTRARPTGCSSCPIATPPSDCSSSRRSPTSRRPRPARLDGDRRDGGRTPPRRRGPGRGPADRDLGRRPSGLGPARGGLTQAPRNRVASAVSIAPPRRPARPARPRRPDRTSRPRRASRSRKTRAAPSSTRSPPAARRGRPARGERPPLRLRRGSAGMQLPSRIPSAPWSGRSVGPNESVVHDSNQQIAPADIPAITTPAFQAAPEHPVQPVETPQREQIGGVAAGHVHGVLAPDEVRRGPRRSARTGRGRPSRPVGSNRSPERRRSAPGRPPSRSGSGRSAAGRGRNARGRARGRGRRGAGCPAPSGTRRRPSRRSCATAGRRGAGYSRTDGGRSRSNMWTVSTKRTCLVW